MNLKADHCVDDDGAHYVSIEGLRVWVHKSDKQWIAQGIDIDYATAGESQELAAKAFVLGICLTIVEHVKRFHSLEKLLARRAPDEIFQAWIRELESQNLASRSVDLTVPESELGDFPLFSTLPSSVKFFEPAIHVN